MHLGKLNCFESGLNWSSSLGIFGARFSGPKLLQLFPRLIFSLQSAGRPGDFDGAARLEGQPVGNPVSVPEIAERTDSGPASSMTVAALLKAWQHISNRPPAVTFKQVDLAARDVESFITTILWPHGLHRGLALHELLRLHDEFGNALSRVGACLQIRHRDIQVSTQLDTVDERAKYEFAPVAD